MTNPKVAGTQPIQVHLDEGEYFWCACGHSQNQPHCDGSHQGTGIEPYGYQLEKPTKCVLCLCKHTKNPPFCDGSHHHLEI